MSYQFIEEWKSIPDFCGICPSCRTRLTHIHDLKCHLCDNQETMWCPKCITHVKFDIALANAGLDISDIDVPTPNTRKKRSRLPPFLSEEWD